MTLSEYLEDECNSVEKISYESNKFDWYKFTWYFGPLAARGGWMIVDKQTQEILDGVTEWIS